MDQDVSYGNDENVGVFISELYNALCDIYTTLQEPEEEANENSNNLERGELCLHNILKITV